MKNRKNLSTPHPDNHSAIVAQLIWIFRLTGENCIADGFETIAENIKMNSLCYC
ncbi:MAG: hypothetical protein M5F18_04275 [Asgard group archaeon]|nr:hypothetical protein [Asgard group archaeon]